MAATIAFSTSAGADSAGLAASQTLTIPATVRPHDLILIWTYGAQSTGGGFVAPTFASTGSAPIPIGQPAQILGGGTWTVAQAWYVNAGLLDPGATLTLSASPNMFLSIELVVYHGAALVQPDTISAPAANAGGPTVAAPLVTTTQPNDWAVYLGSDANSTNTISFAGGTSRAAGPRLAIYDSNGPVAAGTTVGGGTWTSSGNGVLAITLAITPLPPAPLPPFFPAGYQPQQADFAAWWWNNASFFQAKTVFRGVQAASPQTLANNANAALKIDTVLEDPYGGWQAGSFAWVPPFSGYYKMITTAQVAAVTTGPANITAGVAGPYNETPAQALASAAHPTGASAEFGAYLIGGGSQAISPVVGLWNGPAGGVSTSIAAGEQSSFEIIWLSS